MQRRNFPQGRAAAAALAALYGRSNRRDQIQRPRVVIVGGGYGGATAAKYLRMWEAAASRPPGRTQSPFISPARFPPQIGGMKTMADITHDYDTLRGKWGVRVIQDEVLGVDSGKRSVPRLAKGGELSHDRLVLSPGVDFPGTNCPASPRRRPGQGAPRLEGRPPA